MVSGDTQKRVRRDMTSLSFRRLRLGGLLVWASLVTTLMGAPAARAQHFLGEETAPVATSSYRTVDGLGAHDIVARMIERNRLRQKDLQSYSAVRTYEIQNQDGRLAAQAVVSVDYRAPGTKTFHKVSEKGSWVVRHMVFDRLLQSEEETSSGHERSEAAISEENYSFTIIGETTLGSNRCYIVQAQPKRTDKYLFEGQLWIDAQDFGIAKISGHPARRLSFWVNHAEFVREFQKIDGFWLPFRDETIVDVKIHGTKIFRIEHQQYVINATNHPQAPDTELESPN